MALDDIYKEVILDHYKSPRNKRELPGAELAPNYGDVMPDDFAKRISPGDLRALVDFLAQ